MLRYFEVRKTSFEGSKEQLAFFLWSAPERTATTYTYEAWPLRGHFIGDEYVLDEQPDWKQWLVIDQGVIRELRILMFATADRKSVRFSRSFVLRRVARDPDLDRRLRYPPAE